MIHFILQAQTSVHAARNELGVVVAPQDLSHLAVVALQVEKVVERGRRVDLDDVAMRCGKHVASIRKRTLFVCHKQTFYIFCCSDFFLLKSVDSYFAAAADGKVLELLDVVDEDVHEAEFVGEADEHVETRRMQGDAVGFLGELAIDLQVAALEVPDLDRTIAAARRYERLANAHVHARDRTVMVAVVHELELGYVRLPHNTHLIAF